MNVDDNSYEAAQRKVSEELQRLAEIWGPRECPHGSWEECEDECKYSDTEPVQGAMLSEFVVVASWTRMDTGRSYMNWVTAPNQLLHHTTGLLHEALYD